MKYQHIVSYVANTLWAIMDEHVDGPYHHAVLTDILEILAFRAVGGEVTPAQIEARLEEIQARVGHQTSPSLTASSAVAIVPIRGVIAHRMDSIEDSSGGTSTERIGRMIDAAAADETVGTILYDIDSPGGTVPGVQELADKMFALRSKKYQIAQVNSLAASAAYWLASQADEIVSIQSGHVGSIGVFGAHEDVSAALKKAGIKVTLMSAGKYKTDGNPFVPLSEEAKAFRQTQVDAAYAQFVGAVARGRGVTRAMVRHGYGEGRVLTAPDALEAGMIDHIGTMEETISTNIQGSRSALRADTRAFGPPIAIEAGVLTSDEWNRSNERLGADIKRARDLTSAEWNRLIRTNLAELRGDKTAGVADVADVADVDEERVRRRRM